MILKYAVMSSMQRSILDTKKTYSIIMKNLLPPKKTLI